MPGFFLTRQDEAQAIRAEVGADNLRVQFDCYHCQIVEGDLAVKLRRDMAGIGHIQIAGVPDRHEPDLGELNYPYLFEQIDALGYAGWQLAELTMDQTLPALDVSAGTVYLALPFACAITVVVHLAQLFSPVPATAVKD